MTTTILASPLGFLSVLQSQQAGSIPNELADVITPAVELMELYIAAQRETMSTLVAVTAANFYPVYTVPAGEAWYVKTCSARWTGAIGDVGRFCAAIRVNQMNPVPLTNSAGTNAALVAADTFNVASGELNMWLRPGTEIGVLWDIAVAGENPFIGIVVSRFRSGV